MVEQLEWQTLPAAASRQLAARILGQPDIPRSVVPAVVHTAPLLFYSRTHLARLQVTPPGGPPVMIYALYTPVEIFILDGTSAPVHAANAADGLKIGAATAADYLRFFLFAVRGADGHPFLLIEKATPAGPTKKAPAPQDTSNTGPTDIQAFARPLEPLGVGDDGRFRFKAVVAYDRALYACTFAVGPDGRADMLEDERIAPDVPAEQLPVLPELRPAIAPPKGQTARPAPPAGSSADASVLRTMVEVLLEHALLRQESHRLLQHFNARTSTPLAQFANFVVTAAPVVALESVIPFVEEEVAQIVVSQLGDGRRPEIHRGHSAGGDDTRLQVSVPSQGDGIVLVPCHAYRSIVDIERVGHEMGSRHVAVLIGCERVADLPDALRRVVDLTLSFPVITPSLFEVIFTRAMGAAPPTEWQAEGTFWVKHTLHTDLQQPRHLGLPSDKAFAFVRERVIERLRSVDPVTGPGLAELHGLGEARRFAEDLIADIHEAIAGRLPWKELDRGALLVGPPGTGKTTLARAIAKDCGVKFITASAAGWQAHGHLGDYIRAIRSDFAQARRYAPSIIFIDEIDSIGNRETFSGQNAQYSIQVVNAVLDQMQGVDPSAPVFVIAATNHADRVDPALKRAGRLDRVIEIPYPNAEALVAIFTHHLRSHATAENLASDVDPQALAALSFGFTGADVELAVRGAARRARKARRVLAQTDLVAEITGKPRDPSLSPRLTQDEIARLAIHEAGHALARCLGRSRGQDIAFVSIVPGANGRLGFVASMPPSGVLRTRLQYLDDLEVVLAGRAAEEVRFGTDDVTGGAGGSARDSDLAVATRLATQLVTQYGLGADGDMLWTATPSPGQLARAGDLLREAYASVLGKLRSHQARLLALADELRQRQELTGADVRRLMGL